MDYLSGGDLRYHICKHRRFTEEQTRKLFSINQLVYRADVAYVSVLEQLCVVQQAQFWFCIIINIYEYCLGFFIACLIAGLEYVHNKNILHRDIKPENLVFEDDGKYKNRFAWSNIMIRIIIILSHPFCPLTAIFFFSS